MWDPVQSQLGCSSKQSDTLPSPLVRRVWLCWELHREVLRSQLLVIVSYSPEPFMAEMSTGGTTVLITVLCLIQQGRFLSIPLLGTVCKNSFGVLKSSQQNTCFGTCVLWYLLEVFLQLNAEGFFKMMNSWTNKDNALVQFTVKTPLPSLSVCLDIALAKCPH